MVHTVLSHLQMPLTEHFYGKKYFSGWQNREGKTNFTSDIVTRKYPLRGYFLGVLTHTTAWDQLWGGDETLKCGFKIKYT